MEGVANERKRKMDSCIVSVSGDNSSVDAKQRKCSHNKNKARGTQNKFFIDGHVSTVYIGNVIPKVKSNGACSSSGDSIETPSPQMFRFHCQLGDQWLEGYNTCQGQVKGRRKSKITTGDYEADVALTKMVSSGFTCRETLSKGKYASVVLSTKTTERRDVAIKILKGKAKTSGQSRFTGCCGRGMTLEDPDEIQILASLNHQNIVEMVNHMYINNRHCLILGFCENGNMASLLRSKNGGLLPERVVKRYAVDVVNAVEYLHTQMIAHCSLTAENCLLDKFDRIRLCGFSSAVHHGVGCSLVTTYSPPMPYHPPEVLLKHPYDPRKMDMWEVGVLFYQMLTSHYVYGDNVKKVPSRAQKVLRFDQMIYKFSNDFCSLLPQLLSYEPDGRPSILQVQNNAWLCVSKAKTVSIGYHYLVRRPRRGQQSSIEEEMKKEHGI